MKKIAVLLAGSGVYDGSELHETVSVLIALSELGAEAVCVAPDQQQVHAVNHVDGSEHPETRNILIESARIARGKILPLSKLSAEEVQGLVIPGGFGVAKNLCTWAFDGPEAKVNPEAAALIQDMVKAGKPVAALCVAPVLVAKALQAEGRKARLTLGSCAAASPYDIAGFHEGIASLGMEAVEAAEGEVVIDEDLNILSTPCYMMEASPAEIFASARAVCKELLNRI